MAFGTSGIFRAFVADVLGISTTTFDLHNPASDVYKVALFDNAITTPDKDATATQASYAGTGSVFTTAREVISQTSGWAVGGIVMTSATMAITTASGGIVQFSAANIVSGASAQITGAWGCLTYNDSKTSPPDQAVCFNTFNGANGVSSGTLTIVWNANGLFRITV